MNKLDLDSLQFKQGLVGTLLQHTPVAYMIIDKSLKVQFVNEYFAQFKKMKAENILGKKYYNLFNISPNYSNFALIDAIDSGRSQHSLKKYLMPDGSASYMDDFAIPIKNEDTEAFDYILEIMIDRTKEIQLIEKNNNVFLEIINLILKFIEKKDYYTCLHSRNVSAINAKIAEYIGLGEKAVFNAALGGLLHDLGKLYISDSILQKQSALDDEEYALIKEHPIFTWILLKDLNSFETVNEISIAHHERWDGKGYPSGLKGEEIPIEARITAIADTYDAMTTTRPYRKALDHKLTIEEIKKNAGTQFDPELVEKFIQMVEENSFDRDSLISPTEVINSIKTIKSRYDISEISHENEKGLESDESSAINIDIDKIILSDSFIECVLNNTPAFYMIVDHSFNVLYISDNFATILGKTAEEIVGKNCLDAMDKKMSCFQTKNGTMMCPVVRAFISGETERLSFNEDLLDSKIYFETYAVPFDLENTSGEKIECCLEIIFDRTAESTIQNNFENDLKQFIVKMQDLVNEILPDVSKKFPSIVQETSNFEEYLGKIQRELSGIVSSSENEIIYGQQLTLT